MGDDNERPGGSSGQAGCLTIVGIGPGDYGSVTGRATEALREADCIVGYSVYVDLLKAWLPDQQYIASAITFEVERARDAVERALSGQHVALIGSGDAGVYGLAGLALQILAERNAGDLRVEVVPGVTAALSAAALLGAPLGHDFAVISLSDLLTPWERIRARLVAAAAADFVTVLYNPASEHRKSQLRDALAIFRETRSPETPVGLVSRAFRHGQRVAVSTLAEFNPSEAGMLTTVIIGNSTSFTWQNRIITPRGYHESGRSPEFPKAG